MKKSFAHLEPPVLAAVIKEKTPAAAIAAIRAAEEHGAMAFDLHLSCLDEEYQTVEQIKSIVDATEKPMLGLNYNVKVDTGIYECSEEDRIALLWKAAEAGIAAVDIQGYTYDLAAKEGYHGDPSYSFAPVNPKEVVTDEAVIRRQRDLIDAFHANGTEVLMSNHPLVRMTAEQILDLARLVAERNPDVIKIVSWCETDRDVAEAVKAMVLLHSEIKGPQIHFHASGPKGRITRLVNPLLGAYLTFCVDKYGPGHDVNQMPLATMKEIFDRAKQFMN